LGNFDECLNVTSAEVLGKYCLGTIPVDPNGLATAKLGLTKGGQLRMLGNDPQFSGLHFAACIPHKCTAEDATKTYLLTTFDEKYCYSKETQPKLDAGAIATITILSVFLLIVILSTSYDLYLYYKGYRPGSDITVAFSFFTNGRKLIKSTTNPEQLLCLNGMKAISMMWIVMAHEYVNGSWGAVANYLIISEFIQERANMFVVGATIAVDTFFVIGGLVTVYTFLKATDKGVKFNIVLYYVHRYLRLTPAVAIVILIHATLLKHLGDGPLWSSIDDHLVESCRKHWWAALLYIQNYVHDEQACVPQTWYLSIDMQLFILSPLVLLPLKRKPKWTLIGLVVLVIAGIVVPFAVAFHQELTAFLFGDKDNVEKYMFSYYEQTYGRFGAYVIGMILGYLIYKFKKNDVEIKFKWFTALSLWIICLAGGLACVYAGHGTMVSEYNKWSHSLYIAFNRPAWALAISGIIFLCVAGYGGEITGVVSM
jgi:peptidoglycan/LPS O-acetylase OafA/YrhL